MEGEETDSRWVMKTAGRRKRRRSDSSRGGGETQRRWRRRVCAEGKNNWPDGRRWCGAVAG